MRIGSISTRLGLANGLDVPVVCQMLCFGLNGDLFQESALASSYASIMVRV